GEHRATGAGSEAGRADHRASGSEHAADAAHTAAQPGHQGAHRRHSPQGRVGLVLAIALAIASCCNGAAAPAGASRVFEALAVPSRAPLLLTGSAPMATNPTNMVKTTARWLSFRMLPAGALAMAAIALASFAVRASTGSHSKSGNSGCVSGCQNQWSADGGKGVTCAAGCAAKRNKCTSTSAAGASTRATCTSDCHKQWINAGGQCGGANQACLAVARAAYDACVAACANPAAVSCRTAFAAC